jgi:hypothetical protein
VDVADGDDSLRRRDVTRKFGRTTLSAGQLGAGPEQKREDHRDGTGRRQAAIGARAHSASIPVTKQEKGWPCCSEGTRDPGIAAAMPYKTARAQRSISTYGLTHIALGVKDPSRAFEFYRAVLGMFPTSVDPRPVARRPS